MNGCDDFEVAIERRLHGALPPDESEALEAHLAGCERCRAYRDVAIQTEDVMHTHATALVRTISWEDIRTRIERLGAIPLWRHWGAMVACLPLLVLTRDDVMIPILVAISAGGAYYHQRRERKIMDAEVARVSETVADLTAVYRGLVRGQITLTREELWAQGLGTAGLLGFALLTRYDLGRCLAAALLFAFMGLASWRRLRQLERELRALG